MSFQMFVPTKALFGAGQLNHLHEQALPGKKALLVISNGKSTKVNGYLDRTEKELHTAGVETVLFDQVEANPLKSTVMRGGAMARENQCDFIVALGGGSCIDAAKGIAVVATNDGSGHWSATYTIVSGSIEEKILALQERKAELAAGILSEDHQVDVKFGTDDLAALFEPLPD